MSHKTRYKTFSQADLATLETAVNGSGKEQLKAIDELGERHEAAKTAVPKLRQLLKSDDDKVRWRAARALGDFGSLAHDAAGDLRMLLKDKDPIVEYHGNRHRESDARYDAGTRPFCRWFDPTMAVGAA